jgi:hypothetical protein
MEDLINALCGCIRVSSEWESFRKCAYKAWIEYWKKLEKVV